jgi:mannan endo-1,4-beta-mannosidase
MKTLLTFLFLEWITFTYAQRAPVTPNASTGARNVLSFFYQLRKNNQILLGQNLGHGTGISLGYVKYVEGLNSKYGKYIGFVGGDYGLDPNHDVQVSNQILIEHSRKGGIVTVSWHFDNPWTGGDSWDTNNQENLLDLINQSQCNSPCKKWNAQKIQIANALRPLRDSNVPVLWRPLHEMNGDWFWWGQKTWSGHENGYIELWRDLFNFLSRDQNLNNLIWVFSVANTWDRLLKSYFPGSDVVDIIGIDIYGDEAQSYFSQRDYSDLQSLGDFPMGLTEFGPNLKSVLLFVQLE